MQNYTLIAPYTLQVTYDKQNSQKKEVYQYNKGEESTLHLHSDSYFIEKYINGYSNILNTISKKDKVYFVLSSVSDRTTTIQFVQDFLIACFYTKLDFIIFDRSRCCRELMNSEEELELCEEIEMMFRRSDLPVIYVDSYMQTEGAPLSFNTDLTFKFYQLNGTQINSGELNNIATRVHTIIDLKEALFFKKDETEVKVEIDQEDSYESFRYAYTLN